MSEGDYWAQESDEEHRPRAKAIRVHSRGLLGRGFNQIRSIHTMNTASRARRNIAEEGQFYRQQRMRGLSKGLKSLWSNTDNQKQHQALHYFDHRLRSVVFGAWMSVAGQLQKEGEQADKHASASHVRSTLGRSLQRMRHCTRVRVRGGQNQRLSLVCMYLLSIKKGWQAIVGNRRRNADRRRRRKVEFVFTLEQSEQQRLMSKWFHLWKTRRIHSDLLLFHFAVIMKDALEQWRGYVNSSGAKRDEERKQMNKGKSHYLKALSRRSIRRLGLNVISTQRARHLRRVDISSLDELSVRRVFTCLNLQRERRTQGRRGGRPAIVSSIARIRQKIALRHLRAVTTTSRRTDILQESTSDPFCRLEAKKRMLLQWLRLLTRNLVAYQARTTVDEYMLYTKPFRTRAIYFDSLRQRGSTLKLHRRRESFASLSWHNRVARRALRTLTINVRCKHRRESNTRRAIFVSDIRGTTSALTCLRARCGPVAERRRDQVVRGVHFWKLWHSAKALYNWRLYLETRRDNRLRWAEAQQRFKTTRRSSPCATG